MNAAGALYDAEAVLSNPSAFKAEEIRTLRDQITSNLERAWEITGRSEDELTGVMVQISQVLARGRCAKLSWKLNGSNPCGWMVL